MSPPKGWVRVHHDRLSCTPPRPRARTGPRAQTGRGRSASCAANRAAGEGAGALQVTRLVCSVIEVFGLSPRGKGQIDRPAKGANQENGSGSVNPAAGEAVGAAGPVAPSAPTGRSVAAILRAPGAARVRLRRTGRRLTLDHWVAVNRAQVSAGQRDRKQGAPAVTGSATDRFRSRRRRRQRRSCPWRNPRMTRMYPVPARTTCLGLVPARWPVGDLARRLHIRPESR